MTEGIMWPIHLQLENATKEGKMEVVGPANLRICDAYQ